MPVIERHRLRAVTYDKAIKKSGCHSALAERGRPARLDVCLADGNPKYIAVARDNIECAQQTGSTHITPVGGNVFLDLGFPPEQAAALLAESERIIAQKLAGKAAAHKERQK